MCRAPGALTVVDAPAPPALRSACLAPACICFPYAFMHVLHHAVTPSRAVLTCRCMHTVSPRRLSPLRNGPSYPGGDWPMPTWCVTSGLAGALTKLWTSTTRPQHFVRFDPVGVAIRDLDDATAGIFANLIVYGKQSVVRNSVGVIIFMRTSNRMECASCANCPVSTCLCMCTLCFRLVAHVLRGPGGPRSIPEGALLPRWVVRWNR